MDYQPDDNTFDFEMTPSKPEGKADSSDELILNPSSADEQPEVFELTLEAEGIFKAKEITFDGEEESEARIKDAMEAYDKAMDQAAGLKGAVKKK